MTSKRAATIAQRTKKHTDAAARATDGFVRTPASLADDIVSGHRDIGALPPGARVLEPSAGDGALVRAILDNDADAHVVAVEPNGPRADALDAIDGEKPEYAGRVTVFRGTLEDFAAHVEWCRGPGAGSNRTADGEPFDAAIMNPPFGDSSRADVWIDHVRIVWGMLRDGAQLVSIVPPSYAFRGDKAHKGFRAWAESNGASYEALPGQPFAESGTGTRAGVLTVNRPMPARPDGLPTWLAGVPAVGAPVAVRYPIVTSVGALTMPVQEYSDWSDGHRPRVIRYVGTCYGCARCVWEHDDRHDAAVWEANGIDADGHGQSGPSVLVCLDHASDAAMDAAALRAVAPYWTTAADQAATDQAAPVVYPMDLAAGAWATVTGPDHRGWMFTITGRVMADPERAPHLPELAFPADHVTVRLRTARGTDMELYPLETSRVTVRDVPADVVPVPLVGPTEPLKPSATPAPAPVTPAAEPVPVDDPWAAVLVGDQFALPL